MIKYNNSNKSNKEVIKVGLITMGSLKLTDVLKKKYPNNYIVDHVTTEIVGLSVLAILFYGWYIHRNRNNPKKVAFATALLIASPIPPVP